MLPRTALNVILFALLSACASDPGDHSGGIDRSLIPRDVASRGEPAIGKRVQWGGVILTTTNLEESTRIEVLAYPLDGDDRPLTGGTPLGRFILEHNGFLEPATYAEGRLITVVGTVTGTQRGQLGDSDYSYPVIAARQPHLWPIGQGDKGIGVGGYIGIGTGGSRGGAIGIGF
jgi:outer membrane lipoprotein